MNYRVYEAVSRCGAVQLLAQAGGDHKMLGQQLLQSCRSCKIDHKCQDNVLIYHIQLFTVTCILHGLVLDLG